jgi:hypothetical protein
MLLPQFFHCLLNSFFSQCGGQRLAGRGGGGSLWGGAEVGIDTDKSVECMTPI